MRIVIALGGNALLKRGEPMTEKTSARTCASPPSRSPRLTKATELIISHGNGPQVGLLALQNNAYKPVPMYPLDVIGGESLGMIGYMIQQELVNFVPKSATSPRCSRRPRSTRRTPPSRTRRSRRSRLDKGRGRTPRQQHGWTIAQDNDKYRRVVPSPEPKRIWGLKPLKTLVEHGHIVICCGGGGIPTYFDEQGNLVGAEAVIDKDLASSLLASEVEGRHLRDRDRRQRRLRRLGQAHAAPDRGSRSGVASRLRLREGLDGPEGRSGLPLRRKTGKPAVIGALSRSTRFWPARPVRASFPKRASSTRNDHEGRRIPRSALKGERRLRETAGASA